MIELVKLKHLDKMTSKDVDYAELMTDILGYKNTRYQKKYMFIKEFKKIFKLTDEIRNLDLRKVEYRECGIKKPNNVDNISFRAMMAVQALGSKESSEQDLIADTITIVCYGENVNGTFNTNTNRFNRFRSQVLNRSLLDMIGLYKIIVKELNDSNLTWEKRFLSVLVVDNDYDEAGGHRMNQFNIINTIKHTCTDFNATQEEAWQTLYSITQTNSYSKATYAHIQDEMRQIKERKMRAERAAQGRV